MGDVEVIGEGGLLVGGRAGRATPPPDGHAIVSITDDAGVALVTTAGPHGLVGDVSNVVVTGTAGGLYDGTYAPIGAVVSDTTFNLGVAYAGDSFGGTWSLA